MSKFKTIEEAVAAFRAHSESEGVHWPPVADAAFVAGMDAAFNMASGKSEEEIVMLIFECVIYATSRREFAKTGTMPA